MEINKFVSTIIIFVIMLIVVFLFALPEYRQAQDLQNSLAQKQAEYNSESIYYARIADLIKKIQSRTDVLDKVNSALPDNSSFASLLYFFQKKGTQAGLTINSLAFSKISPQTPDQQVRNVVFTMSLSGTYQGLKDFLAALDISARLFEVNSIAFDNANPATQKTSDSKNPQKIYHFNLEVQTNTY